MPSPHNMDRELLEKLLLGQLPTAEVERLATEYADDARLAELAESLAGTNDTLLNLLHDQETVMIDPEGEKLVERLLARLQPELSEKPRDDTAAMQVPESVTEGGLPEFPPRSKTLPEKLEHYRPIKILGQGGMGTVYLAEDTRLGREVAIKTLRPDLAINVQAKERFLREARSAAKLEHDHIIPIYSVGEAADGTPFLAMPLLKGEPLDALIKRTAGPLPVAMVVRLAREAASGLAAAHARGLIHRDIKPANIWLEAPTGRVKILDFGLAKVADAGSEAETETHLTASGAIVGTPAYMAPEQANGQAVDGRADLFSLGCVLYELLAGKRPFTGPNTLSILMSLANHTPPAPDTLSPQCPAGLSRLVMQLLEKDPAKRPASAEAVIQTLSDFDNTSATIDQASRAASAPVSGTALAAGSASATSPPQRGETLPVASAIPLTATTVLPARKRPFPTPRVALALGGMALMLFVAVVYRIQTDKGTLNVEINDDTVEAKLKLNGLEVRDTTSGRTFTIQTGGSLSEASGDYKLVDGRGLRLVVLDADGLEVKTNQFKLVRGEKVRILVTAEKNGVASSSSPQALAINPDRRAAEWVLSIGGVIEITAIGRNWGIGAMADLPQGAFELRVINLSRNLKVSDSGLAHCKDCKNLAGLVLGETSVSDAGLVYFQDCRNITYLDLFRTKVGDRGLSYFKDCKNIMALQLGHTQVSDAGLIHFQDCKRITQLYLGSTMVSDAGLAYFRDCKDLKVLHLGSDNKPTNVSDVGLANFHDCENITNLDLTGIRLSDMGLAHFQNSKNLTSLKLDLTTVSDRGLERITGHTNLSLLQLMQTKVTEAGVKKLSAALPGCKIEWDGGSVIQPSNSTDPDRRAAAYVLSIGGSVQVNEDSRELTTSSQLPHDPLRLKVVLLHNNKRVSDAGLAAFAGCQRIEFLDLRNTTVSDVGLAHFKDCLKLKTVGLSETKVTDAGLVHLKQCWDLESISLSGAAVSDVGMVHFQACEKLTALHLNSTRVTDAGLANFAGCTRLTGLHLLDARVTEAGLAHFKDCQQLTAIWIIGTRPGNAGLAHFKDCKNLEELALNDVGVTDVGLAPFQHCKNLKALWLHETSVTDAGLAPFKSCKQLTTLKLLRTKVSAAGISELKQALPGCRIEWDGGVIEPMTSANPDRRVAEWVLGNGGMIELMAGDKSLGSDWKPGTLPATPFQVGSIVVTDQPAVDDKILDTFRDLRGLLRLSLYGQPITDAGLARFLASPAAVNLRTISFIHDDIGDAGFEPLANLRSLGGVMIRCPKITNATILRLRDLPVTEIDIHSNFLTGESFAVLKGKKLTKLGLNCLLFDDRGLEALQDTTTLISVGLRGAAVSDAGLAHLASNTELIALSVHECRLTAAVIGQFARFQKLATLDLGDLALSAIELEKLKELPELKVLQLARGKVTDDDLARLKGLKLSELSLTDIALTDEGLRHLPAITTLTSLSLHGTTVTEAGVKKLAIMLPKCRIGWNGGVIEP